MKNMLVVSVATNIVLLASLAYIRSLSVELGDSPRIIYVVPNDNPAEREAMMKEVIDSMALK